MGENTHCSFCKKSKDEVKALIVGENACICDECSETCFEVLIQNRVWSVFTILKTPANNKLFEAKIQLPSSPTPTPHEAQPDASQGQEVG